PRFRMSDRARRCYRDPPSGRRWWALLTQAAPPSAASAGQSFPPHLELVEKRLLSARHPSLRRVVEGRYDLEHHRQESLRDLLLECLLAGHRCLDLFRG